MLIHLYNQGNNQGLIYFNRDNYLFFLRKVKIYLLPYCDILAWCLMPNHFHFLIWLDKKTCSVHHISDKTKNSSTTDTTKDESTNTTEIMLSNKLRIMLSSYTQAINKQNGTSGSLFRQNSKLKELGSFVWKEHVDGRSSYAFNCFQYIHQNPLKAGLVNKMEDWEFSSFQDYLGIRSGTLINQKLAHQIINYDMNDFYNQSYIVVSERGIF